MGQTISSHDFTWGGVSSITVRRTSTKEPSAKLGLLSNGATIFYNDVLVVAAEAHTQFELNSYTTRYEVKNDIAVQVTAKQTLFNVEIRAVYDAVILASTTKYNVPLGTRVSSSDSYATLFKQGDYVYTNPLYEYQTITTAGVILTTTYRTRTNPITIAPRLEYEYITEDESQQKFFFRLRIIDTGEKGGRVYMYKSDSPKGDEYTMNNRGIVIGIIGASYDFHYDIETTYAKPTTYIHVRISRGNNEYTEISSIEITP